MGNPLRGYRTSCLSFVRESVFFCLLLNHLVSSYCDDIERGVLMSDDAIFSGCSGGIRKPNETMRLLVTTFIGVVFGFFLGVSFPTVSLTKV